MAGTGWSCRRRSLGRTCPGGKGGRNRSRALGGTCPWGTAGTDCCRWRRASCGMSRARKGRTELRPTRQAHRCTFLTGTPCKSFDWRRRGSDCRCRADRRCSLQTRWRRPHSTTCLAGKVCTRSLGPWKPPPQRHMCLADTPHRPQTRWSCLGAPQTCPADRRCIARRPRGRCWPTRCPPRTRGRCRWYCCRQRLRTCRQGMVRRPLLRLAAPPPRHTCRSCMAGTQSRRQCYQRAQTCPAGIARRCCWPPPRAARNTFPAGTRSKWQWNWRRCRVTRCQRGTACTMSCSSCPGECCTHQRHRAGRWKSPLPP